MSARSSSEHRASALANDLITQHLGASWSFRFDHAKRRAGSCNYRTREITVSKYFARQASDDDLRQVVLHEIAHALAGHSSGHGPNWKRIARAIGYTGARTLETDFARDLAAWVGKCPGGHTHRRFRKPRQEASCSLCSPRFDSRFIIEWSFVPPQARNTLPS